MNGIARQLKRFNIYNMNIASFGSEVDPFTLKWNTHARYAVKAIKSIN
jgi:hypothetical protein